MILRDTFDSTLLNPIWQVSPSDPARYSLTERTGVLRLKHGDPSLFILTNSPTYDFVFELDTDYSPIRASDLGGICIFRDKDSRLELLEYYDPATGMTKTYDSLRVVKQGELYTGYGSNDNGKTWEIIGNDFLSAPKIGMVLHGIQEGLSDTLDVLEARMYRDTRIHVGNLMEGMVVKLLNSSNAVIVQDTCKANTDYVKLDVSNQRFPLTGKIQITDVHNTLLAETNLHNDIWGGDVFWYGIKLDVEIDGVLLRQDREFHLGYMTSGIIERKIFIVNNNDIPVSNVYVSIGALSGYMGWEWVDVAQDVFGQPGTYEDTLFLGNIQPGQRIPVWMKIVRRPAQQMASLNDYKFRVVLESR